MASLDTSPCRLRFAAQPWCSRSPKSDSGPDPVRIAAPRSTIFRIASSVSRFSFTLLICETPPIARTHVRTLLTTQSPISTSPSLLTNKPHRLVKDAQLIASHDAIDRNRTGLNAHDQTI